MSWGYSVNYFKEADISEMCFPDENYDYDKMKDDSVFIGAYDGNQCVGLAILQDSWFKYMYLYDLKVSKEYRQKGVATALIKKAKKVYKGTKQEGKADIIWIAT